MIDCLVLSMYYLFVVMLFLPDKCFNLKLTNRCFILVDKQKAVTRGQIAAIKENGLAKTASPGVVKKAAPAKTTTTATIAAAAPTSVPTVKVSTPVPKTASATKIAAATPVSVAPVKAPVSLPISTPTSVVVSTPLASASAPIQKLTNGTVENSMPISVITSKPKNGEAIDRAEPAKIPTTFIHTNNISADEPNAKKSGIRIKYSGINNGAKQRIAEQNGKPNMVKESPKVVSSQQVPVIASTPIAQLKVECKVNKPVPAVTPKASKDVLDTSFDENVKFADIDDIELPDGTKISFTPDVATPAPEPILSMNTTNGTDISMTSTELNNTLPLKTKRSVIKRSVMRKKHKYGSKGDPSVFACRHCGKRYRWKSTLRRHENDECGNKEPAHNCPYCPYKAKQRGNLGVHVRKHHADKPELESKRKRRTM